MSSPKTSEKSVYLDREEHFHRGSVGAKTVVPYYYDADTDSLTPASPSGSGTTATQTMSTGLALRYDEGATYTYIGEATPGTATSAALWRIKRLTNADNTIVWADGVSTFTKVYDNRASLGYS